MQHVLVVDDEPKMQRVLEIMLKRMGLEVTSASNGDQALGVLETETIDLVMSDLRMPGMSGIELMQALRNLGNDVPVIIMTAYGTIDSAIDAMKLGASDYIVRPFEIDALEIIVNRILSSRQMHQQNNFLRDEVEKGWGEFIGSSSAMQNVYDLILKVAPSKTTVLVTGETGTGKELAARAIHRASPRKSALFVPINCAAIPADILESELFGYEKGAFTGANKTRIGKFELADGGTLFLDELTEMPLTLQAKLLRVLQENVIERLGANRNIPIDIRIIAATNIDPKQAVTEGKLREDLYYRINVFNIELPPLRQRKEDVAALALNFLHKQGNKQGISQPALNCLQNYSWPGNVRELQNVIERANVLGYGQTIKLSHLPTEMMESSTTGKASKVTELYSLALTTAVEKFEADLIQEALRQCEGNKSKASRKLEISERSLWYKLKKYNLET
jgi:two-component system response regulator AtoC